jgi:hypothetical protein
MTAAKAKPARTLRVLGNPIPGLVRVLVTAGRESAEYVFARRTTTEVGVRKAGAESGYTVDLAAGWCDCKAGQFNRGECRHVAAGRKLQQLGHL